MLQSATILNLMALATLLPAAAMGFRAEPKRDLLLWLTLLAAFLGPGLWVWASFSPVWRADFGAAIWFTAAVTVGFFLLTVALDADAWRLTPIFAPAMLVLGALASIWTTHDVIRTLNQAPNTLVAVHIAVSIATYACVTIAAVAAMAAIAQERALKNKKPTTLSRALPAVRSCDRIMVRMLVAGEIVLGIGILSGMGLQYAESGALLTTDHKTVLTLTVFALIAVVLLVHFRTGLRGRQAARWALAAYLLMTLGYPGVKFVTDVVIG